MGKTGDTQLQRFIGHVVGVVAIGPGEELVEIICDGKIAWPRGPAWESGQTLVYGDLRRHNGRWWVCILAHTSADGNAPPDATYWSGYALRRSDSAQNIANVPTFNIADSLSYTAGDLTRSAYDGLIYERNSTQPPEGYWAGDPGYPTGVFAKYWTLVDVGTEGDFRAQVDVENYGSLILWWGDQTEASEAMNSGLTSTDRHPAYAGLITVMLSGWLFGEERPTPPNVELVLRRVPDQKLITNTTSTTLFDGQTPTLTAAAELLTSDLCAGLDRKYFHFDTFQVASAKQADEAAYTLISPLLDSQQNVWEAISQLAETSDAYVYYHHGVGLIVAGLFTHGAAPTTYHTLTIHDLVDPPDLSMEGWDAVKTGVSVTFNDRKHGYKSTSQATQDLRARRVLGEPRVLSLQRPWLTRPHYVRQYAAEALRVMGRPQLTARVRVRRERARLILPGDWVRLDIDPEPGGLALWQFFRVTQKTLPYRGPVSLTLDADETLTPISNTPEEPVTIDTDSIPAAIAHAIILPCPHNLSQNQGDYIILAERPSVDVVQAKVHVTMTNDYAEIGRLSGFAVRGTLAQDLAADALIATVTVPEQVDTHLLSGDTDEILNTDDRLMLILARATTVDGPVINHSGGAYDGWPKLEVCAIESVTPDADGTTFVLGIKRGRQGTRSLAHTAAYGGGDVTAAWVARKSIMVPVWHQAFRDPVYKTQSGGIDFAIAPSGFWFRLQPGTLGRYRALEDCADIAEADLTRKHPGWPSLFSFVDDAALSSNVRALLKAPTWPMNITIEGQWKDYGRDLIAYNWVLIDPAGVETDIGTAASFAPCPQHPAATTWSVGPIAIDPTGYSASWRVFTILCLATDSKGRRSEFSYYINCGPD